MANSVTPQEAYRKRAIRSADLAAKLYEAELGERLLLLPTLSGPHLDCLVQLWQPRWDGNVNSKSIRDELVTMGLADRWNGFNFITIAGVAVLDSLKMLEKERG